MPGTEESNTTWGQGEVLQRFLNAPTHIPVQGTLLLKTHSPHTAASRQHAVVGLIRTGVLVPTDAQGAQHGFLARFATVAHHGSTSLAVRRVLDGQQFTIDRSKFAEYRKWCSHQEHSAGIVSGAKPAAPANDDTTATTPLKRRNARVFTARKSAGIVSGVEPAAPANDNTPPTRRYGRVFTDQQIAGWMKHTAADPLANAVNNILGHDYQKALDYSREEVAKAASLRAPGVDAPTHRPQSTAPVPPPKGVAHSRPNTRVK